MVSRNYYIFAAVPQKPSPLVFEGLPVPKGFLIRFGSMASMTQQSTCVPGQPWGYGHVSTVPTFLHHAGEALAPMFAIRLGCNILFPICGF